jgi:DNA-binding transcriptional regulator YdaS (Cro superfamily)
MLVATAVTEAEVNFHANMGVASDRAALTAPDRRPLGHNSPVSHPSVCQIVTANTPPAPGNALAPHSRQSGQLLPRPLTQNADIARLLNSSGHDADAVERRTVDQLRTYHGVN